MMRRLTIVTVAGVLVLGANGLANSDDRSDVVIRLFQFGPSELRVKAGGRVTWTNQDEIEHTVTSGTPPNRDGAFDFRLSGKGTMASHAFTQSGVYRYFCNRHQHMRGEIRVN